MKYLRYLRLLKTVRRVLYACAGAAAIAVFLLCSVDEEIPTGVIWRGGVVIGGVALLIYLGLRLVERDLENIKKEMEGK